MVEKYNKNLFGRLTKLFRSGPIIRRRVKGMGQKTGTVSTALEVFKAAHSDVYNSTLSAYGAFDRMSRYSDFSEMESCISGDTLIATPDGYVEIQELAKRYGPEDTFIVYSYDHEKCQIVPSLGKQARKTTTAMSYKVTFDSGKVLIATPDHRVMRRDGTYCEVQELKVGDSMMPFYRRDLFADRGKRETSEGYRWIYTMDVESSKVKNGWVPEHRLIAEWISGRKITEDEVVHHKNFKKWDNRPENLQIMSAEDHRNYHTTIINGKKWDESNSAWISEFKKRHSEFMKNNNPARRHDVTFPKILQVCDRDGFNLYNVSRVLDCDFNVIGRRLKENGFSSFETFAKAYDSEWRNNGWDNSGSKNPRYDASLTFQMICDAFKGQSSKRIAAELNTTPIKILNRVKSAGYKSWSDFKDNFHNHKVVSIESYGVIDLYDLTVDGYKNYATDSIIVHNTPEIASALDIYAEETVSPSADGKILHIYSDNRKIQEILENLFYDTLNVEFNLVMWVRNLCKYGDFFLFNDVSPEYGVINCIPISISEIEREEGFDPSDPMAVRYRWITQGNQMLENWQVTHFRLLGNDAFLPYGSSVLEAARRIWRQLILIEDAMLVYRVIRAPERRVFYIDVGNVPPEEVANYLEQAQTSLKRNPILDKRDGKVDLRYNPMAVDQDYFLPVRGGETGTKIDTLAGGQNTSAIEDVQYIQKKLFAALKIPKAYLGYDEDTGAKATLAQEDIRFSRSITRIQKTILSELNKLAMIHLYSHGYEGDDLMDFSLKLSNPSSIAQQQKLELIKSKFEIAGTAPEGLVSRRWIRKNILELTDQEIESIKSEREKDKKEDAAIEAVGTEKEGSDSSSSSSSASGGDTGGDTGGDIGSDTGGGGLESLFAGDIRTGEQLLTAAPSRSTEFLDYDNEVPEDEDDEISIPDVTSLGLDGLAPLRPERTVTNMFGKDIKIRPSRSRSGTDHHIPTVGPVSPNFRKMTGLGNAQSTFRDPTGVGNMSGFGLGETSSGRRSPMSDFIDRKMSQRKSMNSDIKRVLDKYSATVKNDKPLILKEADSNDLVDIDLESLRRKASDE
jgi:hypothetical protein